MPLDCCWLLVVVDTYVVEADANDVDAGDVGGAFGKAHEDGGSSAVGVNYSSGRFVVQSVALEVVAGVDDAAGVAFVVAVIYSDTTALGLRDQSVHQADVR